MRGVGHCTRIDSYMGFFLPSLPHLKDFGAVVELLRNKEGLLHVSELGSQADQHPEGNFGLVRKELTVGDQISVRCIGVDPVQGHIKLSRKSLLQEDVAV